MEIGNQLCGDYNIPLLRKTMEHIEAHPEEWDQGEWINLQGRQTENFCGTTACYAGTAMLLNGEHSPEELNHLANSPMAPGPLYSHLADNAADLLGLTKDEALEIFYSHPAAENAGPSDLRATVERVIGQKL